MLQAVLSFQCFSIRNERKLLGGEAAGTVSLRNPAYLLAKLHSPEAPDDTKILPLVTLTEHGQSKWFIHYRQYPVPDESSFRLLALLPNDERDRPAGLHVAGALGRELGARSDPYVRSRARRLWESVLLPLAKASRFASRAPFELVDVGCGSGHLAARLSSRFVAWSLAADLLPELHIRLIERAEGDPRVAFRSEKLAPYVRAMTFVQADYKTWLAERAQLPSTLGIRIGLVAKVFDLASTIDIRKVGTDELPLSPAERRSMSRQTYLPERCLAQGGLGPDGLIVSKLRTPLRDGHAYVQPSLTRYYGGFLVATSQLSGSSIASDEPWLPVREFDQRCLIAADGTSVLQRLLQHCAYVVVEDQDMAPDDLLRHMRAFSLSDVAVLDMTKTMGLVSNYSYLLWRNGEPLPSVEGDRIWQHPG